MSKAAAARRHACVRLHVHGSRTCTRFGALLSLTHPNCSLLCREGLSCTTQFSGQPPPAAQHRWMRSCWRLTRRCYSRRPCAPPLLLLRRCCSAASQAAEAVRRIRTGMRRRRTCRQRVLGPRKLLTLSLFLPCLLYPVRPRRCAQCVSIAVPRYRHRRLPRRPPPLTPSRCIAAAVVRPS